MTVDSNPHPLFETGEIIATPDFIRAIRFAGEKTVVPYLQRHRSGDWGDISEQGKQTNDLALEKRCPIISVYQMKSGVKFFVITASDRSNTIFCLPEEY